jgi:hypothetical protein
MFALAAVAVALVLPVDAAPGDQGSYDAGSKYEAEAQVCVQSDGKLDVETPGTVPYHGWSRFVAHWGHQIHAAKDSTFTRAGGARGGGEARVRGCASTLDGPAGPFS